MLRNDVGERIKSARLRLAMTQDEVADRAGCARQLVSQIERGAVNTTLDMLEALAAVVGVTVSLDDVASKPTSAPAIPAERRAIADRFLAVLPQVAADELDVFVHQLALWERRKGLK